MGQVIMSGIVPKLAAPSGGLLLNTIAEGSIVKLNENGSPAEFYVAKHNYESGLNGAGRTLLVRKDCYDKRQWHSSNVNAYAASDIDAWFNGDYKALHTASAQAAMGTTKFYYTPGNGNTTVTTLGRSVFALSIAEFGKSSSSCNAEGSALPIASTLQIGYYNGSAVNQIVRTPNKTDTTSVFCMYNDGDTDAAASPTSKNGSRPAFTLPSTALFNPNTLLFVGVA